ncbi:MAG TPA: hypothetical protein VN577_24105 [Terriglobales bacterium]|nr:hypothetical protein [Terriglobales bacterium]
MWVFKIRLPKLILLCSAICLLLSINALSQAKPDSAQPKAEALDASNNFDFEVGSWKIHLKRLLKPLTGSKQWVEFDGTSKTRRIWDGRAYIEEFLTDGPSGKVEGITLRLYNPTSRQWNIYWANAKDGKLGVPTVGEFKNGRGEFYDQEEFNGRTILVRYVWSDITPNSAHFEQSFSDDGGKTWEVNWITDQTRVPESDAALAGGAPQDASATGGPHDFDFEFGTWKTQLKRLANPLSGSSKWADYEGTTTVQKLCGGRANLVELVAEGQAGRFEGLNLRLYNPQSRQWSLYFASPKMGVLAKPTIGEFKNGRGEFYSHEEYNGRMILVRFVISPITPDSYRFEQAFSDDGGKTWEVNWIATDTRVRNGSAAGNSSR